MEAGIAVLIVVAATVIFVGAVVYFLRRFKKANAGKYAPGTEGKGLEVRRLPKEGHR